MSYLAFIGCMVVMGIVALLVQTVRSAGPEPVLKVSAAIISSTFAFLLLIPMAYAIAQSIE